MNLSDEIKQTLHRGKAPEPQTAVWWSDIVRRARRRRAARLSASAGAVTLVVAGLTAVALSFQGQPQGFIQPGAPDFTDATTGLQLDIPDGWESMESPSPAFAVERETEAAAREALIPDHTAPPFIARSMYVSVATRAPTQDVPAYFDHVAQAWDTLGELGFDFHDRRDDVIAGHRAITAEYSFPPGFEATEDWLVEPVCLPFECVRRMSVVDWEGDYVLFIMMGAPDQASWDTHVAEGEALIDSMRLQAGTELRDFHGTLATDLLPGNRVQDGVVDFLEARVAGAGAEAWLGGESLNGLYRIAGQRIQRYEVQAWVDSTETTSTLLACLWGTSPDPLRCEHVEVDIFPSVVNGERVNLLRFLRVLPPPAYDAGPWIFENPA